MWIELCMGNLISYEKYTNRSICLLQIPEIWYTHESVLSDTIPYLTNITYVTTHEKLLKNMCQYDRVGREGKSRVREGKEERIGRTRGVTRFYGQGGLSPPGVLREPSTKHIISQWVD